MKYALLFILLSLPLHAADFDTSSYGLDNYFVLKNSASGSGPKLTVEGPDSSAPLNIQTNGCSDINLGPEGKVAMAVGCTNGVNVETYLKIEGGQDGGSVKLYSRDITQEYPDIGISMMTEGNGKHYFVSKWNSTPNIEALVNANPNQTHHFPAMVSGTNEAFFYCERDSLGGPDCDLKFQPLGAGKIKFGTYTASTCTIGGYIQIKDAGGTLRKLAVCQ